VVDLPVIGENLIRVVAAADNGTKPTVLELTVVREQCGSETIVCPVDIKPGSCPNPLNVGSKGALPVAILGTDEFDVTEIDRDTVRLVGVAALRSAYEDVGTPFYPLTGKSERMDCTEQGGDGIVDLTLKFDRQQVVEAVEQALGSPVTDGQVVPLQITGNLLEESGGDGIEGEDVVIMLRKGEQRF
jgi:hypothetical protein